MKIFNHLINDFVGGNQRELHRAKTLKAQQGKQKASNEHEANKGMTLEQRKARDAELMRLKQEKKKADQGEAAAAASK